VPLAGISGKKPSMRFAARTPAGAMKWQRRARARLFELMMGGKRPENVAPVATVLSREDPSGANYTLEELSIPTLPDRAVHCWMAVPRKPRRGGRPAILALHGHAGTGEQMVRGESLYWYGPEAARKGYIVISPDIGSHDLQHADWTLMGERTWDALCCVDYLLTRPEVNPARIGTMGLSLGGETVMYVAALDERIGVAVSSGWLTTVANMLNGHCTCFNFPGLEETFDFSDIFSCVAPRPLVLELGMQETAPGGFPVEIGREALAKLQRAYRVFEAEDRVALDIHDGGHAFVGKKGWAWLRKALRAE
jgi:hypothetical protein